MTYCEFSRGNPIHGPYHDFEYGFYRDDESVLFERLLLEINQAGLSWETVLKKRDGFRIAYAQFDVDRVANFDDGDRARLMDDPSIIRNRLKIEAAIFNANVIKEMRTDNGFAGWLRMRHPLSKADWVKEFKKTFRFTGGEIVGEFLLSLGILPGAHNPSCPFGALAAESFPSWLRTR